MDDPRLGESEHLRGCVAWSECTRVSGTAGRMWTAINHWRREQRIDRLTVMDVGCGNAALLRNLWTKAQRHGIALEIIGCDLSSQALEFAKTACERRQIPIQLHQVDVTCDPLPMQVDVVVCSLFLHHFESQLATRVLQKMAAAAQLVLIEDLIRSRIGYALCGFGVQLLSRSPIVHFDGPQSVRAAFTIPEMTDLLEAAGLRGARIRRHWPERLLVSYRSQGSSSQGNSRSLAHA